MKTCPECKTQNTDEAEKCDFCGHLYGSEIAPTTPPTVDNKIYHPDDLIADRYVVVKELGRGGMGVVYLVRDTGLRDREVALKMIHMELIRHAEAKERFEDEVIICQELTHANIVKVFHLDRIEGHQFFTMEYIAGRSLREVIKARKPKVPPFDLHEVVSVIDPLLDALSYAHQFTIHRDIKPENVMITGDFPDIGLKVILPRKSGHRVKPQERIFHSPAGLGN